MKRVNAFTIFTYSFAIFGVAGLIGCLVMGINTKELVEQGIETTGTVVKFAEMRSQGGSPTYAPVVEFTTIDGSAVRFQEDYYSDTPSHRVGDKVEIIYDPTSPNNASINTLWGLWGAVIALGILGFVFCSIGFGIIFYKYRKKRQ